MSRDLQEQRTISQPVRKGMTTCQHDGVLGFTDVPHLGSVKGLTISKAISCMKIYLYKQKWHFLWRLIVINSNIKDERMKVSLCKDERLKLSRKLGDIG